ncbi:nitroreductase [Candidatus Woesearchaeota archaeon]|jgi:nitroreductase|nr:nitroreductase [Candidatus Woesearchaeota archaeon]
MNIFECIRNRRSIRKYTEQPIEFDKLTKIIEAGTFAPSAGNMQNWRFVLVTDKNVIKNVHEHCLHQEVVYNAQALIVVCGLTEKAERLYGLRGKRLYTIQNCACAIQNMLLEAHALGLGTCWVGAFNEDKINSIFNIPENARPQAIITIGYPNEKPKHDRKDLSSVVYFNNYGLKIKDLHLLLRDYSVEWKKQAKTLEESSEKGFKKIAGLIKRWLHNNLKTRKFFDRKL